MGQHHAFGLAGGAAGGHHEGVSGFDRGSVQPFGLTAPIQNPTRTQGVDQTLTGRDGQTVVDRERRIAPVPDTAQGNDEGIARWEVDGHQLVHGQVA